MIKLEYLTCSNDCYFDTNYYPTTATSVYFKYSYLSSDTGGQYGGIVANNGGDANGVQSYVHNDGIEFGFCGSQTIIRGLDLRDVVECEFDRDSLTFNGTSYSITSGSNLTNNPFYINCLLSGNWCLGGNYYRVKFYEDNTLTMDLVPCIDNNNTVCFYDEVGQSYIYPIGSGTPTAGPVADNVKYVEYIQTNGTQIAWDCGYSIGTDINAKIYLDFMPLSGSGFGDVWYAYICDGGDKIYLRARGNQRNLGLAFGNNRSKIDSSGYYTTFDARQKYLLDKNGLTDYSNSTLLIDVASTSINSPNNLVLNAERAGQNPNRCMVAKYYGFKVVNGSNQVVLDMRPCLDGNNNPCFYDEVSQTFKYHSGSGTPIAGPFSSTIIVSADKTRIPASGGTINVTVQSDYDWTASSTGSWYTMSSTSGTSADTTITITVPSTTSVTQVEDTITFTNATGDTDSLTIKQSKYSVGVNNFFVGTENVEGMMIGGQEVEAIYLGTEVVYSPGPFVGLKLNPSTIQFSQDSGLTSSMKVKSSEAWTLALPNDATWLSASTLSGVSGETTVTLSTTEENTGDTRTAVITATTASFSATCTVNQNVTHYVSWIFTTNPSNSTDYRDGIEIGDVWSADAEFRIKGTMQGYSTGNGVLTNYNGSSFAPTRWFWVGGNMYYDMNGDRLQKLFTPTSGVDFDYTISNWGVYDNLTSSYVMSGTPKSSIQAGVVWLNMRTCKISSLEIKQGNTLVFDGKAAVDNEQGIVGLYDTVSGDWFYNSGLSMTYA